VETGIQNHSNNVDSRFRGNDTETLSVLFLIIISRIHCKGYSILTQTENGAAQSATGVLKNQQIGGFFSINAVI